LIHGHDWQFDITFKCDELDKNHFVVDVGELKAVRKFLEDTFDHTLLINEADVVREDKEWFEKLELFAKVVTVPNCGMEGLAQYVLTEVNRIVSLFGRGLHVVEVVCWEDSKNRATYRA